ncbi:MAG: hypothetical protein Q8O92_01195 [Candidatus Latescibacter sp.]|nr:hypothetical protein [Candidatus Latescibacter sp.]
MKMRFIFLFLLSVTLFNCSKDSVTNSKPVTVEDILTRDDEISGWKRGGVSWTAGSSGELNTHIDGEEPLYTRNGFIEAAMRRYEGRVLTISAAIELRVFDMGTPAHAQSLFNEIVLQLVNPIIWSPGAGEEARIERFPLSQKIVFRKSVYFVSLSITTGQDEALDVLKTFAGNVNSKIQ